MQPFTTIKLIVSAVIKLIVSAVIFRSAVWNNFKNAEKEN